MVQESYFCLFFVPNLLLAAVWSTSKSLGELYCPQNRVKQKGSRNHPKIGLNTMLKSGLHWDGDYCIICPDASISWLTGIEANTASSSSWREAIQYRTSGSSTEQATVNASDFPRWLRILTIQTAGNLFLALEISTTLLQQREFHVHSGWWVMFEIKMQVMEDMCRNLAFGETPADR